MREVQIDAIPLDRLAGLLDEDRARRLAANAELAQRLLADRVVWNVNATASGGGVAEMLQTLLAYGRGAEVDTRWLVLDGTPEFFRLTKRLHNALHGSSGDGGDLGEAERRLYDEVLAPNVEAFLEQADAGDIVLLHDPQTAGMVEPLREAGLHVVWRCHVGMDTTNPRTDLGWAFLEPYVSRAHATIFSRRDYVPTWVDLGHLRIIPPSLDPFSAKNTELTEEDTRATLRHTGLVDLPPDGGSLAFGRRDGTRGRVRERADLGDLFVAGGPVPGDARVVMQVSRWDRLKDMGGVLRGFVDHLDAMPDDAHLVLVGPDVYGVSDDPEGAEVLDECVAQWRDLDERARARVHLVALPMDDVDENAHLVNALQHHAAVVVQKSLVEGFGLTVTEPMWKGRPVVASRIGGIQDQITDGEHGLLLDDPTDLDGFARLTRRLLADDALAGRLGAAAKERVRTQFLGDRHLIQYVELFAELLAEGR
jgi:trehalose synthase